MDQLTSSPLHQPQDHTVPRNNPDVSVRDYDVCELQGVGCLPLLDIFLAVVRVGWAGVDEYVLRV